MASLRPKPVGLEHDARIFIDPAGSMASLRLKPVGLEGDARIFIDPAGTMLTSAVGAPSPESVGIFDDRKSNRDYKQRYN